MNQTMRYKVNREEWVTVCSHGEIFLYAGIFIELVEADSLQFNECFLLLFTCGIFV